MTVAMGLAAAVCVVSAQTPAFHDTATGPLREAGCIS